MLFAVFNGARDISDDDSNDDGNDGGNNNSVSFIDILLLSLRYILIASPSLSFGCTALSRISLLISFISFIDILLLSC